MKYYNAHFVVFILVKQCDAARPSHRKFMASAQCALFIYHMEWDRATRKQSDYLIHMSYEAL